MWSFESATWTCGKLRAAICIVYLNSLVGFPRLYLTHWCFVWKCFVSFGCFVEFARECECRRCVLRVCRIFRCVLNMLKILWVFYDDLCLATNTIITCNETCATGLYGWVCLNTTISITFTFQNCPRTVSTAKKSKLWTELFSTNIWGKILSRVNTFYTTVFINFNIELLIRKIKIPSLCQFWEGNGSHSHYTYFMLSWKL